MEFKKGMDVVCTFHGVMGYKEISDRKVHSIRRGIVYLADEFGHRQNGITFDEKTGMERENFHAGMRQTIQPKETQCCPKKPSQTARVKRAKTACKKSTAPRL